MKPPIPYYGGKNTLADQIVAMLPPHRHYVEPFAGSLAVLLAKPPSSVETVNDLDEDIVTFWRVLRDRPDELLRMCILSPHSRVDYVAAKEPCADELERARRVWTRLVQSRSGRVRGSGWRVFVDASARLGSMSDTMRHFASRFYEVSYRLAGVTLECRDALEMIDRFGGADSTVMYVDPPYLASTRNSIGYQHEMGDEQRHRELGEALRGCRATILLSGYDSPLYAEVYDGWHRTTISARSDNGNWLGDEALDPRRVEVIWSNRPFVNDLFAEGEMLA